MTFRTRAGKGKCSRKREDYQEATHLEKDTRREPKKEGVHRGKREKKGVSVDRMEGRSGGTRRSTQLNRCFAEIA